MLFDIKRIGCNGACDCDENSNWLVPKSSVDKIEYPNHNQAYITPDNTVYTLDYEGKKAIPINGGKEQPTQIENEDGYLEVANSGTYDVTINASSKLLTDISDKIAPNLLRFSEGTEFQSNYWSRLTSEVIDGQESFKISRSNWAPGSQRIFATLDERFLPTNLQPRELYTISMSYYIVPDGNFTTTALTDFIIRITDGVTRRDISTGPIQDSSQGEWHRISGTAEFPEGFQISVVSFNLGGNGTVYFRELKVETGSKPSSWVPNYRDLGTYEHEVNKEIHISESDRETWDSKQAKLTAGNNITISEDNTISLSENMEFPIASNDSLGTIKVGQGLDISDNGILSTNLSSILSVISWQFYYTEDSNGKMEKMFVFVNNRSLNLNDHYARVEMYSYNTSTLKPVLKVLANTDYITSHIVQLGVMYEFDVRGNLGAIDSQSVNRMYMSAQLNGTKFTVSGTPIKMSKA